MKEQKNIERLFQEKFKDFEVNPPEDAWTNIEARLQNKKKKKRVIPFWLKASGIAAGLLLFIWTYSVINNDEKFLINDSNNVVNQEKNDSDSNSKIAPNSTIQDKFKNGSVNTIGQGELVNEEKGNSSEAFESTSNKYSKNTNSAEEKNNFISNQSQVVKNNKNKQKVLFNNDNSLNNSAVVNNSSSNFEHSNQINKNLQTGTNSNLISENNAIANSDIEKTKTIENNQNNELSVENQEKSVVSDNLNLLNKNEIIVENQLVNDSTQVLVTTEVNELEQLLKEKEEGENADEKEKEKRDKWVVSTNAAPVYFNSFSQGSPIDEQFSENAKNYGTSLSYGVGIQYELNDKLAVRAGVNNVAFNYSTNDVYYTTALKHTKDFNPNINENVNGTNILLFARGTQPENASLISGDVENYTFNEQGSLKQDIGYIEVPLELSYKVLDKKFGINIIGGFSTLFLNNNSILLETNNMQMEIGKANNLNNIHFSSNVGLGFKYTFWKSFNANFQPMFKYQINTFSENSGNFKPYFVGLYSGISFSF